MRDADALRAALSADHWTADTAMSVLAAAEALFAACPRDTELWRRYLEASGRSAFLSALPDRESRHRWAESAFRAIDATRYSLADLLSARVATHPHRALFVEGPEEGAPALSYAAAARRLRGLAALFLAGSPAPRVAICAENGLDAACADLACLVHGLFVTPLNVQQDAPTLAWIFRRLGIDTVVTDTDERTARIGDASRQAGRPLRVLRTGTLDEACARLDLAAAERTLSARDRPDHFAAATAMFTSGSTGRPKGVLFSPYHLVAKRFARAAALPAVGSAEEVLLCYLPLYHTFGRFLEMLGAIYWGATYVFAGNPSAEALLAGLRRVEPTGLVSIPLRWSQVAEAAGEDAAGFRQVVGRRLRWGLSAAGYLDPRVFRYFHRHGVDLASGFGMTEATGGITMTPPRAYVDGTVGVPLPGIRVRLGTDGEMHISGHYVARYLPEEGDPADLPRLVPGEDVWLPTGDLFRAREDGYLEIVDRVKDIYKNTRGQTVAPRRVEQRFDDVPGVKRAFLVGDHRDYNVLLIVPREGDPVLAAPPADVDEYFRHVVRAANEGLAPSERVVNFALLDRDFEEARGELTPKGSLRRRAIEDNFRAVVDRLYERPHVDLIRDGLTVRIPRWFFRDLGVLETDLALDAQGLVHTATGRRLVLTRRDSHGFVRIGDLEYPLSDDVLDLGHFARQPLLWAGNPSAAAFCPVKDGWDLPPGSLSDRVRLPASGGPPPDAPAGTDTPLARLHALCATALFAPAAEARPAVEQMAADLPRAGARHGAVLRRRLEALSRHPDEAVRCRAYRALLLDEPAGDYGRALPAFVESGRSFLDDESVREIARADPGPRRLAALRRRLADYRERLPWPAASPVRDQFVRIFALLASFAREQPGHFATVRSELALWSLFTGDPPLAAAAAAALDGLSSSFAATPAPPRIEFDEDFPLADRDLVAPVLLDPCFLATSVAAAFEDPRPDILAVRVSRLPSGRPHLLCRVALESAGGRRFDLLLAAGVDFAESACARTVAWMQALSVPPEDPGVLPRFGVARPDLRAFSTAFVDELPVEARIRDLAGEPVAWLPRPDAHRWRRLLVRGMAAFFRLWRLSGCRLVPGALAPGNAVAPAADFSEGGLVLSLAGARPYAGPRSLAGPLARGFLDRTAALWPASRTHLRPEWLFEASLEGLGPAEGEAFLGALRADLASTDHSAEASDMAAALGAFLDGLSKQPALPLALDCAVERYGDWAALNPGAAAEAREDQVRQLIDLYGLSRRPDLVRFALYRRTFFADAVAATRAAFDAFLAACARSRGASPFRMEELTRLQATLSSAEDREVFGRMLLPRTRPPQPPAFLDVGEGDRRQIVVRTTIADHRGVTHQVREPVGAAETGRLFRVLLEAAPLAEGLSPEDRFLLALDGDERVVAALRYRLPEPTAASLEQLTVSGPWKGRGIGSALLEDFCARLAATGVSAVRTRFVFRRFFSAREFRPDARWGGLVRFLR